MAGPVRLGHAVHPPDRPCHPLYETQPLGCGSNLRVRPREQLRQIRAQLPCLDGSIYSTDDCRHSLSRNAPSLQPLPNVWLLYAATACKFGLIALTQGEDRLQRLAALGSVGFRCSHGVSLCGGEHYDQDYNLENMTSIPRSMDPR